MSHSGPPNHARSCSRCSTSERIVLSDRPAAARARTNPASTSVSNASQLIRPSRNARLTQVSYDGQAQARASLAFTDPERPAIDTIDLQGTRETITSQHGDRSGEEAQVQGL